MMKITLKPATNGVIKEIYEDNYSGDKEKFSSIEVYEEDNNKQYIADFFYDLCEDLGLHIGNKFDKDVLKIDSIWGSHYNPTAKDIEEKIKNLKAEISVLEEWKKKTKTKTKAKTNS